MWLFLLQDKQHKSRERGDWSSEAAPWMLNASRSCRLPRRRPRPAPRRVAHSVVRTDLADHRTRCSPASGQHHIRSSSEHPRLGQESPPRAWCGRREKKGDFSSTLPSSTLHSASTLRPYRWRKNTLHRCRNSSRRGGSAPPPSRCLTRNAASAAPSSVAHTLSALQASV